MKKSIIVFSTISFLYYQRASIHTPQYEASKMDRIAQSIDLHQIGDIPLPQGYVRVTNMPSSFAAFLRNQKLKKSTTVYLFDGRKKANQSAQYAVLDVSVGNRDLQQCADAVMRLRGEFLFSQKAYTQIEFHSVDGELMRFVDWANGNHNLLKRTPPNQKLKPTADISYTNFLKYMNFVFAYASTLSLAKELVPLSKVGDVKAGDVFIKGGAPGHAVTIVDVARHVSSGKKIFLIAQSYMPAQDIHILLNPNNKSISPWYAEDFGEVLLTPEWRFARKELCQFRN